MTEKERVVFDKITKQAQFSDLYDENFQGLICGVDSIYILKLVKDNGSTKTLFSRALKSNVDIESKILHRIIGDDNIEPYFVEENNEYIIFPYDDEGKLISAEKLEIKYPLSWNYLKNFKQILKSREKNKFNNSQWYQFSRNQALDKQKLIKILIPHVVKRMRVAFDEHGEHFTKNVGVNSIVLKSEIKESPYYILALLNSSIASFYIAKTSIFLNGGFYASNKQFASSLPVKRIDFKNSNDVQKHDNIVQRVIELIKLKNAIVDVRVANEKEIIVRKANALQKQIDNLVYELYNLGDNDKEVILKALPTEND